MPGQLRFPNERETVLASILKSRLHLDEIEHDLHDTVLRSCETISQSLDLIAKADAIARQLSNVHRHPSSPSFSNFAADRRPGSSSK
jgi:hypothetical protein